MPRKYKYNYIRSRKHRLLALLLCVCFGMLGLHYFYVNRYWRGALNLLLTLLLTIASNVFGLYYFAIMFSFTGSSFFFIHWREILAVSCALILGLTLIYDFVRILQGNFRDAKGYKLQ